MLASLALALASTAVQEPVVLLARGDEAPDQPGSEIIRMGGTTVNDAGGWAVMIVRKTDVNERDQIVGSRWEGDPVGLIHNEGKYSGFWQGNFENQIALDDAGRASYLAGYLTSSSVPETVYRNELLLMKVGDPLSTDPTQVWRSRFKVETTRDGEVFFLARYGMEDSNLVGEGVFRGPGAIPVIKSGDLLPGIDAPLPMALSSHAVEDEPELVLDLDVSPSGQHVAVHLELDDPSSDRPSVLVVDGEPYDVAGWPVQEHEPTGFQHGETWSSLSAIDVRDDGGVLLAGAVLAPDDGYGVVVADGVEVFRRPGPNAEQDPPIDPVGIDRAATGDWVAGYGTYGVGYTYHDVVVNGLSVLRTGDRIDLDGDGVDDADLHDIPESPVIDEQRRVFVTFRVKADEHPPSGGALASWAVLQIQLEDLLVDHSELSAAAGGHVGFRMFAPVEQRGRPRLLLGSLSGTSPGLPLAAGTLPLVVDAYMDLCLSGGSPIHNGFAPLGPSGESEAGLSLSAGLLQPLVGGSLHHAYVVFDDGGAVTYVSKAVETRVEP